VPSALPAACAISVVPPCAGGAHLPLDQGGVAGSVVRCGARDRAVVTGVAGDGPEPMAAKLRHVADMTSELGCFHRSICSPTALG